MISSGVIITRLQSATSTALGSHLKYEKSREKKNINIKKDIAK
jgi:hypothetical protein